MLGVRGQARALKTAGGCEYPFGPFVRPLPEPPE